MDATLHPAHGSTSSIFIVQYTVKLIYMFSRDFLESNRIPPSYTLLHFVTLYGIQNATAVHMCHSVRDLDSTSMLILSSNDECFRFLLHIWTNFRQITYKLTKTEI